MFLVKIAIICCQLISFYVCCMLCAMVQSFPSIKIHQKCLIWNPTFKFKLQKIKWTQNKISNEIQKEQSEWIKCNDLIWIATNVTAIEMMNEQENYLAGRRVGENVNNNIVCRHILSQRASTKAKQSKAKQSKRHTHKIRFKFKSKSSRK